MKLVSFKFQGSVQIGVLHCSGKILPLQQSYKHVNGCTVEMFDDMLAFLQCGKRAVDEAQTLLEDAKVEEVLLGLHDVSLVSPLPRPESIRDCMVFEEHIINCIRSVGLGKLADIDKALESCFGRAFSLAYRLNKAWYERPVYYKSNRFSVVGTGAEVEMPGYADKLDYELEWGIVIGKKGKSIPKEKAGEYIAGYTIFNDFSARDIQMKEQKARLGPAKGKDFDTGNAIGPVLVTPDEIPDPYNLKMSARINGETVSEGTSADMHWTFEEIISYISKSETLYPGEFIGSGTCSNKISSGCGLENGHFLSPGDCVELEVEKIGILKNTIKAGQDCDIC